MSVDPVEYVASDARIPLALGDKVILVRDLPPKYVGSIVMPSTQDDDKTVTGTVVNVGPDVHDVFPLDKVMFSKFAGTEVEVAGSKYLILHEREVYGVVQ